MLKTLIRSIVLSLILLTPAAAQMVSAESESEWQATITGQVEAFRVGDGPAALAFATADFRTGFSDPAAFIAAIRNWGYGAIMDSRSHSFGTFEVVSPNVVRQDVTFTGPDQSLYDAMYQLQREPEGWRVYGVELKKTGGLGV